MRHVIAALLTAMGVAAWAGSAALAAPQPAPKGAEVFVRAELRATVESVDMTARQVLLRDEAGKLETVKIGPEARNLGQVMPGDHVTVALNLGVLAQLAPSDGTGPVVARAEFAGRTPPGAKPGGGVGDALRVRVLFHSYDPTTKIVTFTLPSGTTAARELLTPEMQTFASGLRSGDKVDVTFVRVVGIAVTSAK
jgi:hypothetical protein